MVIATHRRGGAGLTRLARQVGCSALLVLAILTTPTRAGDSPTLDGVWQSIGYDLVLTIEGDRFALYETTPICNVKVEDGDLRALPETAGTLRPARDGKHLSVHDDTSIAPIVCRRIAKMPDAPTVVIGEQGPDPLPAFDIVWHTFDDNYAFFKLRGIDWNSVRDKYRGQLSDKSTDAELFDVLASMLAALGDNHVELNAKGFNFEQHRELPDVPLMRTWVNQYETGPQQKDLFTVIRGRYREYIETSARLIADQMTDGSGRGADEKLVWGLLPDGVGYLGIRAMAGFVSGDDAPVTTHLAALESTLDRAMTDLADARAMIVDVRFNGGGWDPAAVRIANRFADRRRAAFRKKARTADGFTPPYTVYVEPAGARTFTRPVVLLTSPMTASAAEIFVFCMNVLPHVQQAGLPTMGIHSDQLVRHLPNGWKFSLSNEVYETTDGRVYEKIGIPPAVRIPMFTDGDFAAGHDSVIDNARKLLDKNAAND